VVLEGAKEPVLFVSTDLTLSALQIIELYGARFSIEISQPYYGSRESLSLAAA
jgi:hypothetical protein